MANPVDLKGPFVEAKLKGEKVNHSSLNTKCRKSGELGLQKVISDLLRDGVIKEID